MSQRFQMDSYLQDLELLVNTDSGTADIAGVAQVADWFHKQFQALGWRIQTHSFSDGVGPCLEITNGDSGHYDVLLMGHMDTVFAKGTARERPFTVRGGRAYGPGVIDMKAGLLLAFYALRQLGETGQLDGMSICLALNSDEETGSPNSRLWLEALSAKSRAVLVLEPARANGALVLKRKGLGRYQLLFEGIAAHAGVEPEKGASAIGELGHWIVELHRLTDHASGTTVNVGLVNGGTSPNVVAAKATAEVDFRLADPADIEKINNAIQSLLAQPRVPGVRSTVSGGITRPVMMPTNETKELCSQIERIGSNLGIDIQWAFTGGGSDGNFSAAMGIPTIDGLGPIGGGAHGLGEYLELTSVEERLRLLKEIIIYLKGASV